MFFNDQLMNDFNTLFHSLPPQRNFHAAGVPGPFHGRLFPKASLDFAYCSCALNWLSQVPKAVTDHLSPAWNKGKVHYTGAKQEVVEAYSNHYAHDIESFLEARAEELVAGGLMALLVPADPAFKTSKTSYTTPTEIDLLGSCLVHMAKKVKFDIHYFKKTTVCLCFCFRMIHIAQGGFSLIGIFLVLEHQNTLQLNVLPNKPYIFFKHVAIERNSIQI